MVKVIDSFPRVLGLFLLRPIQVIDGIRKGDYVAEAGWVVLRSAVASG